MKFVEILARMVRNSDRSAELLSKLVEARDNQSHAVNERLDKFIDGLNNQSSAVNERLDKVFERIESHSGADSDRLGTLIDGLNNQSRAVNDRLDKLIEARDNQSHAVNERVDRLIEAQDNQSRAVNERLDKVIDRLDKLIERLNSQLRTVKDGPVPSNSALTVYICHSRHENDWTYAENVSEFCAEIGIASKMIELSSDGQRPELLQCLGTNACTLGFNSQLDHSWIGSDPFLTIAEARNVPVTQWILDHPSSRWSEFYRSTSTNSRYLFHSQYSEQYFHNYCLTNCATASVVGVGPNKRSRVSKFSKNQFLTRQIRCLIPLNLARIGGTLQDLQARIEALDPRLAKAVTEAFILARHDLVEPLECHLAAVLDGFANSLSNREFNSCMQIVEEKVQAFRRLHVFKIARDYPVLIQSDHTARPYVDGATAEFAPDVGMQLTLSRMPAARAVVSVSHLNDMIHDRTLNGLNAGCVNIIEDSLAHRRAFQNGENALFFRYEDESLRECLELVCSRPEEAYLIAEAGLAMRDGQPFRFGGFHNIINPKISAEAYSRECPR
jgi:hypothetical protein